MKCDVYLTFDSNCEEAITFYKDIFDGEFRVMMRYKDGPPEYMSSPEIVNKIMHVTITFGNDCELKASDSFHQHLNKSNNFNISFLAEDDTQAQAVFNGLSEGGTIIMPYENVFWGGKFGNLIDKLGIQWMVSFDANEVS